MTIFMMKVGEAVTVVVGEQPSKFCSTSCGRGVVCDSGGVMFAGRLSSGVLPETAPSPGHRELFNGVCVSVCVFTNVGEVRVLISHNPLFISQTAPRQTPPAPSARCYLHVTGYAEARDTREPTAS